MKSSSTMNGFDVIGWADRPDEFLDVVSGFGITAEQFRLGSKYRKAVTGDEFRDLSFCLEKGDNRLAVPCHKIGNALNFNNAPISFLGSDDDRKLVVAACDELLRRAAGSGVEKIIVADRAAG